MSKTLCRRSVRAVKQMLPSKRMGNAPICVMLTSAVCNFSERICQMRGSPMRILPMREYAKRTYLVRVSGTRTYQAHVSATLTCRMRIFRVRSCPGRIS